MYVLLDLGGNAVPLGLRGVIVGVHARTGVWPDSVFRGPGSGPILARHGKHDQAYLSWGWEHHLPGFLPANPVGGSTHDGHSDAVAYAGPRGRPLDGDWQVGMDYPDIYIPRVMAAMRQMGLLPIHPYPTGSEYHHLNLARRPMLAYAFLPLKQGNHKHAGLWNYVMNGRLRNCGYHQLGRGRGPLLHRTRQMDHHSADALGRFQQDHHLTPDKSCGPHTWVSLRAAERVALRHPEHRRG